MNTSVSALVRDYLKSLVMDPAGGTADERPNVETEAERRGRTLHVVIEKLMAIGGGLSCGEPLHGYVLTTGAQRTPRNLQKRTESKKTSSNDGVEHLGGPVTGRRRRSCPSDD